MSQPTFTQEVTTTFQKTPTPSARTTVSPSFTNKVTSKPPKVTNTATVVVKSTVQMPDKTPTTHPPIDTCKALMSLAHSTTHELLKCVAKTEEPCDRLNCNVTLRVIYTAEIILLPCHKPPAVQIFIREDHNLLQNKTVTDTQIITIHDSVGLTLNVTVEQFPNAIGLQVNSV